MSAHLITGPDGRLWQLMTRNGGNDPDGRTGVILLGSGSGCRWYPYPASDEDRRRMLAGAFVLGQGAS